MSTMIESPTLRPHAPRWIGIALALAAVLYVILQALALSDAPAALDRAPAERRPVVVHPASARDDFHHGMVR
jgi:hypothetical protein